MSPSLVYQAPSLPIEAPTGSTRLGLHVTAEELAVWQDRMVNGPYKSDGDVSSNSPGDWDRIASNAATFLSNPSAIRWTGQPGGSCWSALSNPPALPANRRTGETLRDAAFYYLLTGDVDYRNAVTTELLGQAGEVGTDFTDSVRWDIGDSCASGDSWSWEITMWLRKLLYGYDYIRSDISSGDRTTLDTWFNDAATFWETNVHKTVIQRFPNRLTDDYTPPQPFDVILAPVLTHLGGHITSSFHEGWNNRSGSHLLFATLSGLVTGNTTLQARGKRWFQEWVRFANFADGTNAEFNRWLPGAPTLGLRYSSVVIGEMIMMADAFARTGDTSLYDYSTSLGYTGADPDLVAAGGPKTLRSIVTLWAQHMDGTIVRYGTDDAGNDGDPDYKIDSIDEIEGSATNADTYLAPGNLFWQDAYIKSIYMRSAAGTPAYPATPASGGFGEWGGEWGALPGVLFMFGQMEDDPANPFP